MGAVKAIWKNGQVVLEGPAAWPEGRRLVVTEDRLADMEFMTEEEQSDDASAIERWIEELEALAAMTMTPAQEAEMIAWRQKTKDFNLEAVRQQMEEGIP